MFLKLLAGSILALSIASALAAGVQFAGVNIAGFDFGCGTDVRFITPNCTLVGLTCLVGNLPSGKYRRSSRPEQQWQREQRR